jgi:hypothetical protein
MRRAQRAGERIAKVTGFSAMITGLTERQIFFEEELENGIEKFPVLLDLATSIRTE